MTNDAPIFLEAEKKIESEVVLVSESGRFLLFAATDFHERNAAPKRSTILQ